MITFTFDEIDFSIPGVDDWDLEALEAYEDGRVVALLRTLLGAEQWAAFKAKPRKVADLNAMFLAVQKAMNAGN